MSSASIFGASSLDESRRGMIRDAVRQSERERRAERRLTGEAIERRRLVLVVVALARASLAQSATLPNASRS